MTAIERAIEIFGSQAALAKALGVAQAQISQWKTGERPIPIERCPMIERATAGVVTCEELRPDLMEDWKHLRSIGTPKKTKTSGVRP